MNAFAKKKSDRKKSIDERWKLPGEGKRKRNAASNKKLERLRSSDAR